MENKRRPKGLINTYNDVLSARYRLNGLNGKERKYRHLIHTLGLVAKELYEEIEGKTPSADELRYM